MAHIIDFSIAGLAGRKETYNCKLNRDINVFFGLNGAGKTSLLKILYSAMSGDTKVLETVPFESAEVTIHSIDYNNDFVYNISKKQKKANTKPLTKNTSKEIQSVKRIKNFDSLKWTTQSEEIPDTQHWNHRYLPTSRFFYDPDSEQYIDISSTTEDIDRIFAGFIRSLWLSYSTEVLGNVREVQEKGLTNIVCDVLSQSSESNIIHTENLKSAYDKAYQFLSRQSADAHLGSFEQFESNYKSDKNIRKIINDIVVIENAIEEAVKPQNKLKDLIHRLYSGNKFINFTDGGISVKTLDQVEIGLNSLSSGEKQLLRIFLEALSTDQSTLIIDEPELSMHIDWQKELVSDLMLLNPETQLIIATHSPDIMAGLSDKNIFRL